MTVAFLSVCSFYNSLLFIRVRIYKADTLARERRITISELGPFWEGGVWGRVLCSCGRRGDTVIGSQAMSPTQYSLLCRRRWYRGGVGGARNSMSQVREPMISARLCLYPAV